MSAGRWMLLATSALLRCSIGIVGWVFVAPIAWAMPRRRDWMAVIGRDEGKFLDNAKYFYLQGTILLSPAVRTVFITERQDVVDTLAAHSHEAMRFPTIKAVCYLLRAGTLVVDSIEWARRGRHLLLIGAKRVQLWHGVGFKRIEIDKWRNETIANSMLSLPAILGVRMALHVLTGRLIHYDLVNTTSTFYRNEVFAKAFWSRDFLTAGYPRNTFGECADEPHELVWSSVDSNLAQQVPRWVRSGRRIVLVTPTFRDSRATPMGLTANAIEHLDNFCETHGVELIFKFHPYEKLDENVRGRHLHLLASNADIYPLMPLASAMVSDYSSIYMDFLLLDKPILFLVPDLDEYVRADRQMQFDFHTMTPGPKVSTWQALTAELDRQWRHDDYMPARAELKRKAFDELPQEQAVPKIISFMREHGWLPKAESRVQNRIQPPPDL